MRSRIKIRINKKNLKFAKISVIIKKLYIYVENVRSCNRSLMDKTSDSDSDAAGSIPAGCSKKVLVSALFLLKGKVFHSLTTNLYDVMIL